VCGSEQNGVARSRNVTDRRVQKTRSLLRNALATLISEKPYDQIVIKEILDRANVGRSTFYTHFNDKDDLLISSIHGMVETVRSAKLRQSATWHERILWFSLPIFEYHYAHRHDGQHTMGDRGRAIHHDRLQRVLSEMITGVVGTEFAGRRKTNRAMPPELIAQYIASTFVLVLDWWLDSQDRLPPREIDKLFQAVVLPTLSSVRL
jgi:AcrR family transcriptional regulator